MKRQVPQETDDLKQEPSFSVEDLPEGWTVAQLGQVAYARLGKTPRKLDYRDEGKHRIVKFRDLTVGGTDYSKTKAGYVVDLPDALKGLRRLCKGDVLVTASAHSGDQIGKKCAYVDSLPDADGGVYFVGELLGITSDPTVMDSKWPYLWFLSERGVTSVQAAVAGVHLTAGRAQKIPIPLAPLAEQKRIVSKFEELLARVNATRERLAKVPTILKRFRQAVLAAACSGRLTEDWRKGRDLMNAASSLLERISSTKSEPNVADKETPIEMPQIPENWAWSHCEQLCDPKRSITYGVIKLGPPVSDGVPTLRSSDVRWLYIDDTDIKRISSKIAANYSRTFLKGGEVLVTVRGTLGGVAVVPPTMAGFNISREVAMLPLLSQLKSAFIAYAIASPWCQNWLSEVTKGVAYTGVNIRDLKRLPLPMPPVEEQEEIVRRVKTLLSLADKIESRLKTATVRNDQLTEAALNKAFHGELVPTEAELARAEGRSYEPAADLLERILKEQPSPTGIDRKGEMTSMTTRTKASKISARRQLIAVLADAKKRMTPDDLFAQARFDEDSVEEFYEELRAGIAAGQISEKRPNNTDVYLEATAS